MKFLVVFALFIAAALAAPASDVTILKNDYAHTGVGEYTFGFELSDGQSQQSEGTIEGLGTEDEAASVKGSFSFVGDDGQTYTVTYIADKNGYQPSAPHLPQAPEA